MTKLTESQLAEIAERREKSKPGKPEQLGGTSWQVQIPDLSDYNKFVLKAPSDIDALLAHIAAVTAERDEAEANIGEVNQLLADTLSRTKIAEQQVERLTADLAAANASIEHLRTRVREQTAATQEAYANHEADIRRHLEGIVELGDSSCPIWQRVASAVATFTAEREAIAKYIGYEWSPGSHYDLPEGVKDFVAGEVQSALVESQQRISRLLDDGLLLSQQLAAANQRAEDAARVEREAVLKYANERADAIDKSEAITQREQQMQYVQSRSIRILAKAIARGEHIDADTRPYWHKMFASK